MNDTTTKILRAILGELAGTPLMYRLQVFGFILQLKARRSLSRLKYSRLKYGRLKYSRVNTVLALLVLALLVFNLLTR